MSDKMIEITAPGMYFAMTPQNPEDVRLVQIAVRDAARRTRKAVRFSLPAPENRGESNGG